MRYLAILAVILLTGCSYFAKTAEDYSCPKTGFVAGADTAFFEKEGVTAAIDGFSGACSFKNKGAALVELTLPFVVRKNTAAAPPPEMRLHYFMAVLSPDDEILQRQAFTTKIIFDKKTGTGSSAEEHTVKIPLKDPAEAYKYKVVIGFSLTPEQLRHNQLTHDKESK